MAHASILQSVLRLRGTSNSQRFQMALPFMLSILCLPAFLSPSPNLYTLLPYVAELLSINHIPL